MLNSRAFGRMAAALQAACDALCGGRLVLMHEGGYSETAVPYAGLRGANTAALGMFAFSTHAFWISHSQVSILSIFSIPTVMEALSGETTGCVDPYVEEIEILPYQALQPHQDAVITAAEAIVRKYLVDRKP